VAAMAAAAVAAFLMNSRRGTPPAEEVGVCSIEVISFTIALTLLTKGNGKKFAVNRTKGPHRHVFSREKPIDASNQHRSLAVHEVAEERFRFHQNIRSKPTRFA
jgi:hypothetical protein